MPARRFLNHGTGNTNSDIITKYQFISSANIADTFSTCNDYCVIQYAKSFNAIISKSVTGTICDTVFKQAQNLPTDEDGISLFKLFTLFTVIASLQFLIISFNQITIHLMLM